MSAASGGAPQGTRPDRSAGPHPDGSANALARLLPCLEALGITRLGDITGLDRVGIPVVQAVRPLGLANSVTQGGGLSRDAAAVSAIMEAAEQCFAERIERFDTVSASAAGLGVAPDQFARHLRPDAPGDWTAVETAWIEATDLATGAHGWLPFELVHTAYVDPPIPSDGLFWASTTGLACGFSGDQATLHAVLECVERDAIATAYQTHGFFQRRRIDPATIDDPGLSELIGIAGNAGLVAAFWAAPAAGDIPVVWCQLMESGEGAPLAPYPADGFSADIDPASAARRALVEAAQSRLAAISGARDDITRAQFPAFIDWSAIDAHRRLFAAGPRPIRFDSLYADDEPRQSASLGAVLARLARDRMSVLCVRLDSAPCADIVAVRVIVPELLPLTEE